MPCTLCHRDVHLILAYSWARPAIIVAGKGRGGMFFFLFLLFLPFHFCYYVFHVPLFHLLYYLFYPLLHFWGETTQNDPQGLTCRKTPTQSINRKPLFESQNENMYILICASAQSGPSLRCPHEETSHPRIFNPLKPSVP